MNIDRVGSFRGKIIDRGVAETKNGYPQLILQLQATEHWVDADEVWEPWPYEESEITAYTCLFGKDGKATLGVQQAMKALNWDGMSLAALQTDTTVDQVQWRTGTHTYNEKTSIQVAWLDAYDAEPGRKVKKLDVADIKKLDAKYSAALKAIGGGPKPKSAPAKPPTPTLGTGPVSAVLPKQTAPVSTDPTSPSASAPTGPAPVTAEPPFTPDPPAVVEPEKPKRGRKPAVPSAPAVPTVATMTMEEAWEAAYTAGHDKGKTDVQITQAWVAVLNDFGGDEKVGDWSIVRDQTIAKL